MKAYDIRDEETQRLVGVLLYYEKEGSFIVELPENLDEWDAPLLFAGFVKKKVYTIPRDFSFLWVKERIIPSGRQNIKSILQTHKLKEYDELKFLELSEGRCSQDSLYIKKIEKLPDYVSERMEKNVCECIVCVDDSLLCFFRDGVIKKVYLRKLQELEGIDKVLKNKKLMESGRVAAGGYVVTFNDSIDISAADLYSNGEYIPLNKSDFISFVQKNVLDTTEACNLLECSRQNVSYMIRQKQLTPIKEDVRGNLYSKGDVLQNKW